MSYMSSLSDFLIESVAHGNKNSAKKKEFLKRVENLTGKVSELTLADLKEILDISGVQPIDTTNLGTDYSLKVDCRLVEESKKKNSPVYHLISKNPDSGTFWIYLPEFNGEKGVCFSIGYRDKLDFFLAATYYITTDGKKGIRDTNFRNTLGEFRDMLKQLLTK